MPEIGDEETDLDPGDANTLLPPFGETDFDRIGYLLRGTDTRIVYIGIPDPDIGYARRWWNLNGNYSGVEGLELAPHLEGLMHAAFDILMSQGPYEVGASYERTNWKPKAMKMGVQVNGDLTDSQTTSFRYRMLEQRWWNSWSSEQDGYLGVFTRTHGWRFFKVRLENESRTAFDIDPVANNNNFMQWDMDIIGMYPFYSKKAWTRDWVNTNPATSTHYNQIEKLIIQLLKDFGLTQLYDKLLGGKHIGDGTIAVVNRGTVKVAPMFIVSGPGIAWIQDGLNADGTPRMLQMPNLPDDGGYLLVDTDPDARTLTYSTDPVDALFYKLDNNPDFIDVLLHGVQNQTTPVWKKFKGSFSDAAYIPPRTSTSRKVWHSNQGGTITAIVPQRYRMAWG